MSMNMQIDTETIQALLQTAQRTRSTRFEKPGDVMPFDFHVPHRFAPEQVQRLRDVAEVLARDLTATLSATLQGAFPITLGEFRELYVSRQPASDGACFVPLNFTKLLGGLADAEIEEGRTLSSLENDLLLDVTEKVVAAVSHVSKDNGGPDVTHTPTVSTDPIELVEEGQIADLCRITFQRNEGDKALPFSLVVLSELLEPIAGVVRPPERSTDEIRQDILAHVKSVPMKVNVRLGTVNVSMRDLVSLETGDVILLQRPIGEPIDVIVSGKTIMTGQPVQHHGWYGLQILRMKEDD